MGSRGEGEPLGVDTMPLVALSLRFAGDRFEPEAISGRLGLDPTLVYRSGDPITEDGQGRRRSDGWRLRVGPRETWSVEDLIADFRRAIPVSGEELRSVCVDLKIEAIVVCEVTMRGAEVTPGLEFPQAFLGWLDALGASLIVDVVF